MRRLLCFTLIPLLLSQAAAVVEAAENGLTGQGPAKFVSVAPGAAEIPAFSKFELTIDLQAEYTNPFDPADVALEARFITPAGQEHVVPGFLYWECQRSKQGSDKPWEQVRPAGKATWRIRYCPTVPGEYRYRLVLDDGTSRVETPPASFRAVASESPGMVRIAKANPLYFEHDDGSPYFAIGENVCWPGRLGTYDYDNYWARLSEHGANYARLWIGPFDVFTLERVARDSSDPAGLGRYDLVNSWRLDYVVDLAEQKGLKLMYCIDSFNSLRIKPPHAMWDRCPYNAANGGPCRQPEEFFTNPAARELFKRRLRYTVARWSYSPAILSWEFWNEVNIIEKYVSEDSAAWHREMARYLRELDPYDHLITTSWAGTEGDPAVDALPEMDYIQSHQYGARDAAAYMIDVCRQKTRRYGKPHYFGEFGTGTEAEGTREDSEGIHLHNGLWSGVVSGAAGTAMLWWWDNYVEPKNLYYHFRPVAEFVRDVPFHKLDYRPLEIASIDYAGSPPPPRREALTLYPDRGSWEPAPFNEPITVTVHTDGRVEGGDRLSRVLHGQRNHRRLHNPATFQVDYAEAGKFIVEVNGVSGHGGAKLKVYLNGELRIDKVLADNDTSTKTLTQYDGDYPLDVPAGRHEIRVVNDGNDWLFVGYRLPDYRRRTDPGLKAWGLVADSAAAGEPAALVWIKNERYTWYNHNQGETLRAVPATRATLSGLTDGSYEIRWWDTYAGRIIRRENAVAQKGKLVLQVEELLKDVACQVVRTGR